MPAPHAARAPPPAGRHGLRRRGSERTTARGGARTCVTRPPRRRAGGEGRGENRPPSSSPLPPPSLLTATVPAAPAPRGPLRAPLVSASGWNRACAGEGGGGEGAGGTRLPLGAGRGAHVPPPAPPLPGGVAWGGTRWPCPSPLPRASVTRGGGRGRVPRGHGRREGGGGGARAGSPLCNRGGGSGRALPEAPERARRPDFVVGPPAQAQRPPPLRRARADGAGGTGRSGPARPGLSASVGSSRLLPEQGPPADSTGPGRRGRCPGAAGRRLVLTAGAAQACCGRPSSLVLTSFRSCGFSRSSRRPRLTESQ